MARRTALPHWASEKFNDSICSKRIRELMLSQGKSPADVAKDMYISRNSVYLWLKGRITPKLDDAYMIAQYFGVSLDYLCGKD
ncbi:MAG: helix-turn-helix transcriptional regulator [Bacteroidaceae bacterium]|nr:helix-turn-helix transcriptional regulator [Bacteroidaceae bacterium]MBO7437534.1 helix-turn-helix transcriptional regulator [Bacteroidaceae bacterium]